MTPGHRARTWYGAHGSVTDAEGRVAQSRGGEGSAWMERVTRMWAPRVLVIVGLIVAFVAALLPTPTGAQPAGGGSYIVVLRAGADPAATAAELGQRHGLGVTHVYDAVLGGFAATVPNDAALEALRRNPQVEFVDADLPVFAFGLSTGVDRVGADNNAGTVTTGPGAAVSVLDTGVVTDHPDLTSVVGGTDCTGKGNYVDGHGHGTHVAGTIAAHNGIGVAPGTPIYAAKVLSDSGSGSWSSIICGINWTMKSTPARVLNMSLGGTSTEGNRCNSSSLHKAICDAVNQGARFAVAAGNNGNNAKSTVPAKYPEVTAVSALADSDGCVGGLGPATSYGADDTRASFSNFGDVVDVAAPGVGVLSTLPGGGYDAWNGTSMATPHVAAAMALGRYSEESGTLPEGVVNVSSNTGCVTTTTSSTDTSTSTTTDTAAGAAALDTDADGLTDANETEVYGTDPANADSDADGALDGDEVLAGTDPLTADAAAAAPAAGTGFDVGSSVVTNDAVNLRAAASRQADVVTELAAGTPLTVTGPTEEGQGLVWVPVATSDGTLTGYVAADFLTLA